MAALSDADKTAAESHLAEVTEMHASLAIKLNAIKAEEETALHWKNKNMHATEEASKRVITATEHEAIARGHSEDYTKRIKNANAEFVKATEAREASEHEANEQSEIEAAAHKKASRAQDATVRLNQESEMAIVAAAEANERATKAHASALDMHAHADAAHLRATAALEAAAASRTEKEAELQIAK